MRRWPIYYFLMLLGLAWGLVACTIPVQEQDWQRNIRTAEAMCRQQRWQALTPDLWILHGHEDNSNPANQGRISNIVFARENTGGKPRGWLLGTGASQKMGQSLRCSLESQLGIAVTDIVSVRAHPESVLGASAFLGTRHWALPQVAHAMRERCPRCSQQLASVLNEKSINTQKIAIPDQSVHASTWAVPTVLTNSETIRIGPFEAFEVMLNTEDWTTVFRHSASGIWYAPGLIWAAHLVPDIRDVDVYRVMAALEVFMQHQPSIVIPEQGEVGNAEMVITNLHYWQKLQIQTTQAIRLGDTDVNRQLGELEHSDTTGRKTLNQQRHSLNQQRVWKQLERDYFDLTP